MSWVELFFFRSRFKKFMRNQYSGIRFNRGVDGNDLRVCKFIDEFIYVGIAHMLVNFLSNEFLSGYCYKKDKNQGEEKFHGGERVGR